MKSIDFSKYHANANDFILIDDRENKFPLSDKSLIKRLCHRNLGIGADGIILFQQSQSADAKMRILNSDGSEAESCGNGLCCFTKFMSDIGHVKSKYLIEIDKSIVKSKCNKKEVNLEMQNSVILDRDFSLMIDNKHYDFTYIDSGVPHVVCFVDKVNDIDVKKLGAKIRNHPYFQPHGVNVDFAELKDNNNIKVRTYERGVEDETYACGTGAIAVAIAANLQFSKKNPISIVFEYGTIIISFDIVDKKAINVKLTSVVNYAYSGKIIVD